MGSCWTRVFYQRRILSTDQPLVLGISATKDPTHGNVTNGGACSTHVGLLHPKAIAAKLSGIARCSGPPDTGAYPLNGKLTITMSETFVDAKTGLTKPYQIQTYLRITGVDPSANDVVDVRGMVTKGVAVGATVSGSLFEDGATKNAKTDPKTTTGYHLDPSKQLACQSGNGAIDTVLLGSGTSALGGTAA